MKRFDFRTLLGGGLILLGGLMLLERVGVIRGATDLFWGAVFIVAAIFFLFTLFQNPRGNWWAIIPAMALLGMGGEAILPEAFSSWGGGIFLGALGLAFFVIYATDRARWWGIIPGGVLTTLAVVATLEENITANAMGSGTVFFIGLGLTFLLVAILPNPVGRMQWAYIPAVVLLLMGGLLGSTTTAGLVDYIWPAALIMAGLLVIFGFFINRQ